MEKSQNRPAFSSKQCTACWRCIEKCPRHAIRRISFLWHRHAKVNYRDCIGCNACVRTCPQGCFKAAPHGQVQ